jgi:glycosyltransferase involved in cell wall biosynthesis
VSTEAGAARPTRYLLYTETFPSRDPHSPRQTGIGRYCHDLAAGLSELGHEVMVLTNSALETGKDEPPEPFLVLAKGEEPRSLAVTLRRGSLVTRAVSGQKPDVLLIGDPSAHRVCSWLGPRLRMPYCPIFYGTELLRMEQLKAAAGLSVLRRVARSRTNRYIRQASETICISRYTAELLRRVAPGTTTDCIVYPTVSEVVLQRPVNPAFSKEFRSRLAVDGVSPVVLLTTARISQRKNQLGVLQAMAQVHQSGSIRLHYLILGNVDGSEHAEYRRQLDSFIREHQLEPFVTFIGQASDEEKVDYIDACDVLVMLSRTVGASVEGFGISVIEASCRGKPVLVSDEGGMPETIIEGGTGFAVPPDDITRVAGALRTLAGDEMLRAAMGEAGRRFARTEFTPQVSASRLHRHLCQKNVLPPSGR